MGQHRARKPEEIQERKKEIIASCETLFTEKEYEDITLTDIAQSTALSRPSMYNYYQKKEEVFLDVLKIKYMEWGEALKLECDRKKSMSPDDFCNLLAESLCERELMLKLISMYLTSVEKNCEKETIIAFRTETEKVPAVMTECAKKVFPDAEKDEIAALVAQLFIHIYGIYPSTHLAKNQIEALESAGLAAPDNDMEKVCLQGIKMLTYGFIKEMEVKRNG